MLKSIFNWILFIFGISGIILPNVTFGQDKDEVQQSLRLEEVVVTATKTPHALKDVPVEISVVTKDEIEKSSSQTISDILRYVPGIFVRSEDSPGISSWRAKIRGLDFNSGYGLILIDGQRVKGGGMGEYGYGLNQIPIEMIEKIEILKGPGSVLYGSDAMAGVVNIITKPVPDKTITGFQAGYGSYNTQLYSAYWGTKVDSLGVLFSASKESSEMGEYGYRKDRDEDYERDQVDVKFSYDLKENLRLSLHLAGEDKERKREYLTKDTVRYTDEYKWRVAPELKATFDDHSNLQVRAYYYDWNFKTKEFGTPSGFTPRKGDMYYKNIEARYSKPFWNTHLGTLGVEYLQEELDYNLADKTIDTISGYFQDEMGFVVWKPLTVVLGGRVDNHSEYGTEFCPRLSMMWELTDQTRIRGSIGRSFKSPNIRQLYYKEPYQHGNYWYKSNPGLEAEKSWGYTLGVEQGIGDKVLFNLSLFRNDIKDMVVWEWSGETIDGYPVKVAKNVGKAYTQGVEVGVKSILFNGFSLNLGYTYLDTEDRELHKELTYCPKHNFTGQAIYAYKPWGLTFSLGGQYVSKMYTNSQNTKETEEYWLFDMKVIVEVSDFLSVSLEGNNIFDSDYGEPDRDWRGATWLARLKVNF